MTINDLFDIEWGQKEYHSKEHLIGEEGNTILISSKGEDNGIYGFFNIPIHYKAPFITVPSTGTIGQAFLQTRDCCVNDDVLILKPKKSMTLEDLYQVVYQIRATKWKYQYGRKITPERLKDEKITLISLKSDVFELQKEITPTDIPRAKLTSPKSYKTFKLKKLFHVQKGKGLYLEKMSTGKTPVVSTQISDNGVCNFYDIDPTFESPCITIGRIACNPRVQLIDFATVPDDMYVLIPKDKVGLSFLFYCSAIIQTEGWRFNYSRKATKSKLDNIDIQLPVKNGKTDFEYILSITKNSYGYEAVRKK
jgi:hypothetical protein